ncbi:cyclohexanone monooxygenase, partial [cyanobacterium TDX16]
VAVIGTGATGIQMIAEIADKVGELTVFQRRPNWSAPLNNGPISEAEMADIRARYDEIFATCARTPGGFEHEPDRRGFYEVSREERRKLWDRLYDQPGFAIWLRNFREIFTNEEANAEFSEYIADRIRRRVKDPVVAEKLIPRDHGFGVQRVPMETHYFEAYNRPNVHLVDISETPIVRVTETGLRTTERDYDFDIVVYATGFDAITGAFDHIDIRGVDGETLRDKWKDGPSTFLGMLIHGF